MLIKFIVSNERYVVESVIGKGAYGEVSLIKDKISNNTRAMKVIPKEICNTSNSASVVSEINMLKSLDHPNIIKMYEFYQLPNFVSTFLISC